MKKKFTALLTGIILLLSCPGPQPGTDDPVPATPQNVIVKLQGDTVRVAWDTVPDAEGYRIYRRIGDGGFNPLPGNSVIAAAGEDTDFPEDKELQYAVKSIRGSRFSPMSEPSNTVSVFVRNLQASKLSFNNRIELMWLPVHDPELETYVVYRYAAVNALLPELAYAQTGNTYTDMTATVNTPYFYKVTWKKNSIEYGVDAPFVLGVFCTEIDSYEPNDDYTHLAAANTSFFYDWNLAADWSRAPYIFSFGDGSGGVETDMDWYKYKAAPTGAVCVEILLPADTPFNSAENCLNFQFHYAGAYSAAWRVLPGFSNPFMFKFPVYNTEQELYFRIFPVVASGTNTCGKYKVNISENF